MDPTSHPSPSFEMPPVPPSSGENSSSLPEHAAPPEVARPSQTTSLSTPQSSLTPILPVGMAVPQAVAVSTVPHVTGSPIVADDIDLIEKEWVDKAKAIVAQTHSDPHNQNKEMNRFKADYMKKRYNKDIKISET